jgi:hypothetical protein
MVASHQVAQPLARFGGWQYFTSAIRIPVSARCVHARQSPLPQARAGGDALLGRRLYLLKSAGFAMVQVSPRMVSVDARRPGLCSMPA